MVIYHTNFSLGSSYYSHRDPLCSLTSFCHGQLEDSSQGGWNYSILSKEDIETIFLKRQEALLKRERMKKYSFSHRVPLIGINLLICLFFFLSKIC